MHHDLEYCHGIALVLQGESLKASRCVTHGVSLGTLRERMVARFIRDVTPERLKVETGLLHSVQQGLTSRQCDLLVHDASNHAPLYRWDEFVIAEPDAAEAVVEVKSSLNETGFSEIRDINDSVTQLRSTRGGIPVFAYALEGVTFDTFLAYIAKALKSPQSILAVPNCMAVQQRRYVAVRPMTAPNKDEFYVYAIDLASGKPEASVDGIETGFFIEIYKQSLRSRHDAFDGKAMIGWFERVKQSGWKTARINLDGTIT